MEIVFKQKGNFKKLTNYLEKVKEAGNIGCLNKYGKAGVNALSTATPIDTGTTAGSWYYTIENKSGVARINFHNSNIQNGCPIAIILQYGHATGNGGWVEGRDYINPAIKPVFDNILKEAWEEVTKL